MIQCIAEHSIDVSLLTGGHCIDAGCRGFQFSESMRDMGCEVIALDIEEMEAPEGVFFMKQALMVEPGIYHYVNTRDQQAKFISNKGIEVEGVGIRFLYADLLQNGKEIDVLKLDIEGTEYFLLSDPNFQPIPRQITVEFHQHCHKELHDQYFDKCMENLLKHYVAVKHDRYAAHGAGLNYWDSLFIRKDLI